MIFLVCETGSSNQLQFCVRRRKEVNAFIRSSDLFDGVIDFDAATRDPRTGGLRPEFQPNSSIGGPGDGLHPNRARGNAVDVKLLAAPRK